MTKLNVIQREDVIYLMHPTQGRILISLPFTQPGLSDKA
jgi:hypothetical protein